MILKQNIKYKKEESEKEGANEPEVNIECSIWILKQMLLTLRDCYCIAYRTLCIYVYVSNVRMRKQNCMQGPRLCVYRLAREPGKISCLSWIAKNGASCEVVSEWENSNGCALHTDALLSCCWACCCCCLSSKPRPESFELSQISCAELPHALAEPMSSEFRTVTTFSDVNAALVCCCWACCCCCACCTCC